jgi:hypothetical protein
VADQQERGSRGEDATREEQKRDKDQSFHFQDSFISLTASAAKVLTATRQP